VGDLVKGIEYLGIPMTVAIILVSIWFILHIIGFILDIKGKVVPEIINIRGRRRRKKEEKKRQADLLERLEKKLDSFENHYSKDNITKRNDWMKDVDDRAITCGNQMTDIKDTLLEVTQALNTNTKMTEDMFVENSRDRIIAFAEKAGDYNIILSREQFRRINRIHKDYEDFLEARNRKNGEVDIAYETIQDGYKYRLKHHSFLEDIKGYEIK
jgi:Skp family chaperone for outer membrane proteins